MIRRILALTFATLALCSLVAVVGCAGLQQGIDHTNDYLDRPATTQPGSATNGQNIEAGATVVGAVAPSPIGDLVKLGVIGGMILLHNLDSRRRTAKVVDAVGESRSPATTK